VSGEQLAGNRKPGWSLADRSQIANARLEPGGPVASLADRSQIANARLVLLVISDVVAKSVHKVAKHRSLWKDTTVLKR
jgi:hypothetical protein